MKNDFQSRDVLSKALWHDDPHPTNCHSNVLKEVAIPYLVSKHTQND